MFLFASALPLCDALNFGSNLTALPEDRAVHILASVLERGDVVGGKLNFTPQEPVSAPKKAQKRRMLVAAMIVAAGLSGAALLHADISFHPIVVPSAPTNQDVSVDIALSNPALVSRIELKTALGTPQQVEQIDGGYRLKLTENGNYTLAAYAHNGKIVKEELSIFCIDRERPRVASYETHGGLLVLTLADDGAGVDFAAVHAEDMTGAPSAIQSYDQQAGTVTLAIPTRELRLFVPDWVGNIGESRVLLESGKQ